MVFEICRETFKIRFKAASVCFGLHIIEFSCRHGGDGGSTWAKFDGNICPVIIQKYIPFILYCEVCCCLHVK